MDSNSLASDVAMGEEALALINSPLIKQYFNFRRAQLFDSFRSTPLNGGDHDRKEIHRTLKEVDMFEQHLLQTIETGKMSEDAIKHNVSMARTTNLHKR